MDEEGVLLSHEPSVNFLQRGAVGISVLTDLEEVAELQEDWNCLLSENAAPFSCFDWVMAWYRCFADECDEILVFVATRPGEVIAIFPCYRKGRKVRLAGDITCDYQDAIAASKDDAAIALTRIIEWLGEKRRNRELYFQKISNRGLLGQALESCQSADITNLFFRKKLMPCPCVQLTGSKEEYLQTLPRKSRSEFRRVVNRLDREIPGAVIEILDKETIVGEHLKKAADFHVNHFRKKGESPLADSRLVSLLNSVALSDEVGLRVSWMREGDSLMVVDFAFCRGGTFYGYLTDFDQSYSKLSPGRCLFIKRIDYWIQQEGINRIDLLGGGEKYKKGYTEGDRYRVDTVRIMSGTIGNRIRWSFLNLDKWIRKRVKALIKRWGRFKAGRK